MAEDIINNITNSFDKMGEIDLAGISLETADHRLLDISHLDLDRHVAMQASAIAFYGSCLKDSSRRLSTMKRQYDRWSKKKYAEAKASLASGTGKSTVADVEARFIIDNESDIENWDKQIDKLQYQFDTLTVWNEAWKQKGFSIKEYAAITENERWNTSSNISKEENSNKNPNRAEGKKRVKDIIRQRQEQ